MLDENLLNALLAGLLETDAVAYPLGAGGNSRECRSEVELLREAEGVRTSIRFAGDRINLPLAFRGSYNAGLLGCARFAGTAEAGLNLFFNEARQALLARIVREKLLKARGVYGFFPANAVGDDVEHATMGDGVVAPARQLALARSITGATIHPVQGDHAVCVADARRFLPALLDACASVTGRLARRA